MSQVTVPAYVVASWSDQGLHTRGTFEGFARIGSERKWLDAHGGKKWGYYYSADGLRRQQAFFDHFLLDRQTEISDWPRVRYQVRDRGHEGTLEGRGRLARARHVVPAAVPGRRPRPRDPDPGCGLPRPRRFPMTPNGPGVPAAGPRSTSASRPPPSWSAA